MSSFIQRIKTLLSRRRRARRLGIDFQRAASFRLPKNILISGRQVPLHLPDDSGSKTAFADIMLDDCYGLEGLPDTTVFVLDIGAHSGLFSLAARIRWPRAVIHAYEPNPAMRPFWEHQAKVGNFAVFPEALGAAEGFVSLDFGEDSVHTQVHSDVRGEIRCRTLATAVSRLGGRVDLVKMDCEGAEKDLLQNAEAWQNVDRIAMEYHLWAGYSLADLKGWLEKIGFLPGKVIPAGNDFGLLFASRAGSGSAVANASVATVQPGERR